MKLPLDAKHANTPMKWTTNRLYVYSNSYKNRKIMKSASF